MSVSCMDSVLKNTLLERCAPWLVVFFTLVILLVVDLVFYLYLRRENGINIWQVIPFLRTRKTKLTLREQIAFGAVGICVILALLTIWSIPIYRDIKNDQYICIKAEYTRLEHIESDWFSNGTCEIIVDGGVIKLELPANWGEQEFPVGTHSAIVWYSQDSHIILGLEIISE